MKNEIYKKDKAVIKEIIGIPLEMGNICIAFSVVFYLITIIRALTSDVDTDLYYSILASLSMISAGLIIKLNSFNSNLGISGAARESVNGCPTPNETFPAIPIRNSSINGYISENYIITSVINAAPLIPLSAAFALKDDVPILSFVGMIFILILLIEDFVIFVRNLTCSSFSEKSNIWIVLNVAILSCVCLSGDKIASFKRSISVSTGVYVLFMAIAVIIPAAMCVLYKKKSGESGQNE
jgi:hypothetical protein